MSPDGTWIVSASIDGTIRIWEAATGTARAVLVLPGRGTAVALHPFAPIVTCGDAGGGVHLARLVGLELGPLVVTAAVHSRGRLRGSELRVLCPACRQAFPIDREVLGTETFCPNAGCGRRLRLNVFTIRQVAR